jgi:hypothetical protein
LEFSKFQSSNFIELLNGFVRKAYFFFHRRFLMEDAHLEAETPLTVKSEQSESHRILSFALGSTFVFILYTVLVLEPAGKCFRLDGSSNSLGLTFSYTLEMVQDFFNLRSQNQLDCYSNFLLIWDVIYAVIYASMYCFWTMYFFKNRRILLAIPVLAMVADWAENFTEILMINSHLDSGSISATLVSVGSFINMFKLTMLSFTYLVLIAGIIYKIKSVLTRPNNS